jgi:hypothetical protein
MASSHAEVLNESTIAELVQQVSEAVSTTECKRLAYALYLRGVGDAFRLEASPVAVKDNARTALTGAQLGALLSGAKPADEP